VAATYSDRVNGVFRISEGGCGETPRWWGAVEGSGEGAVPPSQKKIHFYVPKIIILGAF